VIVAVGEVISRQRVVVQVLGGLVGGQGGEWAKAGWLVGDMVSGWLWLVGDCRGEWVKIGW
jgi:hypothetical protein